MKPLLNKVAIVTGGAGGIGAAICHTLAESGASVVVGYNTSQTSANELAQRLPQASVPHAALCAPVTDSAALGAMAAEVDRRYGRCDILVNCAGTTRFVPHHDLDDLDDALIDTILATNVRGAFAAIRALRPLMVRTGDALVINVSSTAAVTAMGSNVMYCASKAALDNMTKSLARALAPAIRVVSLAPGLVDTDFIKKLDPLWRDEQVARTPLGRLASPEDIARAALAIVVGLTFTTGAVIQVDGGRPLA
jgi:3-oxoacyl-[acyl-carrier protein] reductase